MRMFEVIPVIDLRAGQVVHARRGERDRYQPVRSVLCDGAEPAAVIEGLLALHGFESLYIADLDAIQGLGNHRAHIAQLRLRFPRLRLWVDAAFSSVSAVRRWQQEDLGTPIVGAESLPDLQRLEDIANACEPGTWILSLDFRGTDFLGPQALMAHTGLWPTKIIAMNLAKVGSGEGPDLALLRRLSGGQGFRQVFAAGGVRNASDLYAARNAGARGALIATALHDGSLTAQAIQAVVDG
jgi:phosphoribosylformimino-5-aminoimidazole carboxamide ribotide isomerase